MDGDFAVVAEEFLWLIFKIKPKLVFFQLIYALQFYKLVRSCERFMLIFLKNYRVNILAMFSLILKKFRFFLR